MLQLAHFRNEMLHVFSMEVASIFLLESFEIDIFFRRPYSICQSSLQGDGQDRLHSRIHSYSIAYLVITSRSFSMVFNGQLRFFIWSSS